MTAPTLDIPVFDADNHLYETRDSPTRFLPDRYKGAIDYVEVRGRTTIVVRGHRRGNPEGRSMREIFGKPMRALPAFREPAPRIELMDEQGLDRALLFPTLASLIEERMRDHPEVAHAVIHSLNRWLHETWSCEYERRISTTPAITLPIVEKAVEELEWVVEHDVLVAMYSSDSGYERHTNEWLGHDTEVLPLQPHAFRMLSAWRPVEDAVSALVCHGALSRFPQLEVAVIENGSSWVEPLLGRMADAYEKMPQDFAEDPVEVIKRNIYLSPFWEEDLGALARGVPDDDVRKIMGGNLARLMNVHDTVLR